MKARIFHRRVLIQSLRTNDYDRYEEVISKLQIDFDPSFEFARDTKVEISKEEEIQQEKQAKIDEKLQKFKQKILDETEDFENQKIKLAHEVMEKLANISLDPDRDAELIKFKQDIEHEWPRIKKLEQ